MNIDKGDFIALLREFGSEISTSESSFKGIYVPLQSAKQLLDVKLEPGDAVVYTDPATSTTLGEMLSFQSKSFVLVSNSKIQYINGNPIYLELGLQWFLPGITVPGEYNIRTLISLLVSAEYEISEELFSLAVPSSYNISTPESGSLLLSSGYDIAEEIFELAVFASYNIPTPESGSLLLSASYDIAEELFGLSVSSAYNIPAPISAALLLSSGYDIAEGIFELSVSASYDITGELFGLAVPSVYNIPIPESGTLLLSSGYDIAEEFFELAVPSAYNIPSPESGSLLLSAGYDIAEEIFSLAVPASYNIPTPESGSLLLSSEYEISEELFSLSVPTSYDLLEPTAISGLRAEFIAPDAVVLHWNEIDPADADYYEIYRSTSSGFTPSSDTLVGIAQTNSFRNRDLDTDTTYFFKIRAIDPDGNEGAFSSQVSATTSGTS